MNRTIIECDRCNCIVKYEYLDELSLKITSDAPGESELVDFVLCDDCYNKLCKFLGMVNPYTGKQLVLKGITR